MSFLKRIFKSKDEPIKSYADFWAWFQKNEKNFFNVVKNSKDIEKKFFDKISPKLEELKDGFLYVTGMYDDNTVELVITADGNTRNIVFVEELIEQAPQITGWKFTALKPEMDIQNVNISMSGYEFSGENLFFYPNNSSDYPDEIDISIVHKDLTEQNRKQIESGIYIFLDNYLGELDFVNNIDNLEITGTAVKGNEVIPISKLKEYLKWREKEFVGKYSGVRYNTEEDEHSILEAELKSGNKLLATINTQLLKWDRKASHPWIAVMEISYNGEGKNGMPDDQDYKLLNTIQDEMMSELIDTDGYLNIGRQTADSKREIYFACKDFRIPSKVFFKIQKKYSDNFQIDYEIYKDKYWQSFERFSNSSSRGD